LRLKTRLTALLLALCLLLSGCGTAEPWEGGVPEKQSAPGAETKREAAAAYEAPPIATAAFHADKAEGDERTKIDLSAVDEGYVAVSASSDKRLKFQVLKDEYTYNYDISSDGEPSIFPLQCGDGRYTFRVMENIADNKYAQIYSANCNVTLRDEFQPFLRPSDYSNYSEQSECVRKAAQLSEGCSDRLELVSAVYKFICSRIRYDYDKATSVQSGYLPDVDETFLSGKGICFDYASLAAAMLRSQGIPTKIIFGYVAPDNLYHAWNMFYTEESGWVTVSFSVDEKSWNRIDLTFSASGADNKFIGDGTNYTDVYFY
jgi:hypothetical protein